MEATSLCVLACDTMPDTCTANTIYRLMPQNEDSEYFAERTNRNIGWITPEEQEGLSRLVVGVAGCGGMGGQVAEKLLRLGVGEIRIADPEVFDVSNINRQFAARRNSVGVSKACETARMLRDISDDSVIEVYPQGISRDMLTYFLKGACIIVDEIEFWNIGSCILLHQYARRERVAILNGLTVGFAAYLHLFLPESTPVEEMLGMSLEEGLYLEHAILTKTITQAERNRVMDAALRCFIPDIPKYYSGRSAQLHQSLVLDRLQFEGRAPIIATNPPFAGGLVVDHALLYMLQYLGLEERSVRLAPPSPGYLKMDAAQATVAFIESR